MMDHIVDLELCEPTPFMFGDNGHLGVTDGQSVWIVVVTCEALRATAFPPEASVKRLSRYADVYRDMAEGMIARREDVDGKVWIFEKNILAKRAVRSASPATRRSTSLR
ncbi:hypothetical protein [Neorhizobium galegae]|uniref:hypothetical protein n=1 Tax=Neorhizobium galegae TaxID=399 RepID=UPI0021060FFA|nr:hypothetical protein [Neorhizobium galegae]MCQ1839225.1 hypothetical protein [Neorhizobium galegae]